MSKNPAAVKLGTNGGKKRPSNLSKAKRSTIARVGGKARHKAEVEDNG